MKENVLEATRDEVESTIQNSQVIEMCDKGDFIHVKLKVLKGFVKERLFESIMKNVKVDLLIHSLIGTNKIVFGIVHWNAPDFLIINIKQIQKFHPTAKIYVFDNASSQENLQTVFQSLAPLDNITLFSNKKDYSQTWASHIVGLQYLLNYAAKEKDETIVFLDQDCIITKPVDDLADKLDYKTWLVGVRDYVVKPHDYGILKKGLLRRWHEQVHGSFMIMDPQIIYSLFGSKAFLNGYTFEAYHGKIGRAHV